MKTQFDLLSDDITGRTENPIAQAFPGETAALNARLYSKVRAIITTTDPFTLSDDKLTGWYGNLTGVWGEWSEIYRYYKKGDLVTFSTLLPPDREVDIKINENGVEKWIEIKNVETTNKWGDAVVQAGEYARHGAKHVILEFPQQGVNRVPDLSRQQLNLLNRPRAQYPGVNFEVRTGASDPSIQMPYDPPANNWGSYLP